MSNGSSSQIEFYTLLRKHASEWNRAYNKCVALKHSHSIAVSCLIHAEKFNDLADYILNLGLADWHRWRYQNAAYYGILWFKLVDLYGKPEIKIMPVLKVSAQVNAPAQLALF